MHVLGETTTASCMELLCELIFYVGVIILIITLDFQVAPTSGVVQLQC